MSLYAVLGALKGCIAHKHDAVDVTNVTFKLHRFTAIILVGCSILVTSKQFFGDNINCMVTKPMDGKMFESYCFMKATFNLPPPKFDESDTHAHPGVAESQNQNRDHEDNKFHNYYQWVCFVLLFQAIACYFPYYIWKRSEGGRLSKLLAKVSWDPLTETPIEDQVEGVSSYLAAHCGSFNNYAIKYLLCQLANLVNVVVQMYVMDLFLGREFLRYGISLFSDESGHLAVMERVFPKVTKCSMKAFGVSGSVMTYHGLCTLPINIINEKIYIFLWFWFVALACWTILHILMELLLLAFPCLRMGILRTISGTTPKRALVRVLSYSKYGDFVILAMIAKNIEIPQFMVLISKVAERLGVRHGARGDEYPTLTLPMYSRNQQEGYQLHVEKHDHSTIDNNQNESLDMRMRKASKGSPK